MTPRPRPAALAALACAAVALGGCSTPGLAALPPQRATTAPVEPQAAQRVVDRLRSGLDHLPTAAGAAADAHRAQVLDGTALQAANARARLVPGAGSPTSPFATAGTLDLQAASAGSAYPRSMLLLGRGSATDLPVLHVARQDDATTAYRITTSVRLLPGVTINGFTAPATGSAFTAPAGMTPRPDDLVAAYARSLAYPRPAAQVAAPDPYRVAVTRAAADQGRRLATHATYTEAYAPVPGSTVTVAQAGGGAVVVTSLRRTTTLAVRPGQKVATPAAFRALGGGRPQLTKRGVVTTLVTLALQVPAGGGRPQVVGASEQLLSAQGS